MPWQPKEVRGRKLTADDVYAIRLSHREGTHRNDLAAEFNVSGSTITQIVNYESWQHVGPPRDKSPSSS